MEVFDDKTDTKEKAEDIFEDRKLFNDWYERELLKKSGSKLNKPVDTDAQSSYNQDYDLMYKQMYEDRKFKEELCTNPQHNKQDKLPSLELYLQACLILLFTLSKSLNDQWKIISKLSQPTYPLMSYHPDQSPTAPTQVRHSPSFVARYENQLSVPQCYCGMAASACLSVAGMTRSENRGATVLNKWVRVGFQNLKEKVKLTVISAMLSEKHRDALFEIMKSSNLEEKCKNSRFVIKN